MSSTVDEHCELDDCEIFKDYHCLLQQIDAKSDKFYLIQLLLTSDDEFYVWARWGKNGTTGQFKLEGPTEQSGAEKNFEKKFQDKTKNKWENRSKFVPAKGKYTLVTETSKSSTTDGSSGGKHARIDKKPTGSVDEHCDLDDSKLFEDYHCILNQIGEKSDKFYLIQLLENDDGYFVWTRWGKNGTTGQKKLEGPLKQPAAVKNFTKKFQDKTKNKWENRSKFLPAKGKYTLVAEESKSSTSDVQQGSMSIDLPSLEAEKPSYPETVVSGKSLHADILYQIMFFLSTKDVLTCVQVCKFWKMILSDEYFWKMFIYRQFDLTLQSEFSDEYPFNQWADPDEWFCYYDDEDDPYVIRPFPSMWKCGVVHPLGLNPMSGDVKSLQGFHRSLEILTHMKKMSKTLGLLSGNECSASEGSDGICVVMFPWDEDELPNATTILTKIFHFHPEICQFYLDNNKAHQGERHDEELYYHLRREDDDESDHDLDEKPCLNRIFGFGWFDNNEKSKMLEEAAKFYPWLQKIMVPTITVYAGEDKLNPVVVFFLTNLAPGWVGGALTGVNYT